MFAALHPRRIAGGLVMLATLAAFAASVIAGPGHENRISDITGPELIGPEEIARDTAAVSSVSISYRVLSEAEHIKSLIAAGRSADAARTTLGFQAELNSPFLRVASSDVEELTGRAPLNLRSLLEANRDRLVATANER